MIWSAPFEELHEGARFETAGRSIGEAEVLAFAQLTGDRHPQHVDATWAASSPFGERVAHGMLLLSFAVGLIPFDPERVIAVRRVRDVVFKRPVRLGEAISVRGRVAELRAIDDHRGLVRCGVGIVNQREELCCRAEIELLWTRGEALEAA